LTTPFVVYVYTLYYTYYILSIPALPPEEGGETMAKSKKQTQQQQQEPGIIKPDFSELIEKMQQEKQQQEQAGKKQRPKPETKREQEPEVITVTLDDIEPPRKHEGSEQEQGTDTGRAERLQRARELVREEKQEREKEQDSGSEGEGEVLKPIDYPRGGPQTQPDVERQIEILQQAIEQGESIPVIAKRYGVSRRAIQHYIAQAKEEIELNSQLLDIKLVESLDTKIREIVLAVDKSKLATATVRDLAIAAGIFLDKRKELLGPRSGTGNLRLRATFRGEGAIEVTTGEQ
jgi:predicted DNA-binding protein YlxM (UPF0122 family)